MFGVQLVQFDVIWTPDPTAAESSTCLLTTARDDLHARNTSRRLYTIYVYYLYDNQTHQTLLHNCNQHPPRTQNELLIHSQAFLKSSNRSGTTNENVNESQLDQLMMLLLLISG